MKAMLLHAPSIHEYDAEKAKEILIRMCSKHTPPVVAAELGLTTRTLYSYMYGQQKIKYPIQFLLETLEKVM